MMTSFFKVDQTEINFPNLTSGYLMQATQISFDIYCKQPVYMPVERARPFFSFSPRHTELKLTLWLSRWNYGSIPRLAVTSLVGSGRWSKLREFFASTGPIRTWSQYVKRSERAINQANSSQESRKLHGRFLHITDIHPDPYYTPKTALSTSCHRKKSKKKKNKSLYFGTPYSWVILSHLLPIEYSLHSGNVTLPCDSQISR